MLNPTLPDSGGVKFPSLSFPGISLRNLSRRFPRRENDSHMTKSQKPTKLSREQRKQLRKHLREITRKKVQDSEKYDPDNLEQIYRQAWNPKKPSYAV
jgi:DNA-binding transcriptional MerR regulator